MILSLPTSGKGQEKKDGAWQHATLDPVGLHLVLDSQNLEFGFAFLVCSLWFVWDYILVECS